MRTNALVRNKLFLIPLVLIVIVITKTNSAQQSLKHILRAYPDWSTNFSKTKIDFNELMAGGPPKDGIPAILNPKFISIKAASDWLDWKEPVISFVSGEKAKAYPLQILIWHEIVNDKLNNIPILVTFCPLCYSSLVYDRRVRGVELGFGVSGLLRNSDLVMYDMYSESFWQQFTGEAIVGDMVGDTLKLLHSQIISFKQFSEAYPNGKILSRETGYNRKYGSNPYRGYDDIDQTPFMYKGPEDDRLPANEKVIGVKLGEFSKAYPYEITSSLKVINDNINNTPIVIFHDGGAVSALDARRISDSKESGSTAVFNPSVGGKHLTFKYNDNKFLDNQTNSVWDITGKALSGKLKGSRLEPILHGDYFAFAWFAFMPHTQIFKVQ